MAAIETRREGHVAILTLNEGENRFNPDFLTALLAELDRIEQETDCRVLVVTSAHEKIFCNGIDLDWLGARLQAGELDQAKTFFFQLNHLLRRLVTYPLITIAAMNGHVFAGGAIMSCAFDFRLMRTGRGFFCLPEVALGIPFLPGMNAMLKKAIPLPVLEVMQLTGKRYTAEELAAERIITQACPLEDLLPTALALAAPLEPGRAIVTELKTRLHKDILHAIDELDPPYIEAGKYIYS